MNDQLQQCSECLIFKTLSEFSFRKDCNSYRKQCKQCRNNNTKQYNQKNKKEIAIKRKIHYENNKETILLKNREWELRNKENRKKQKHHYYEENKQEICLKAREYHHNNKDNVKNNNKQYRENNKEQIQKNQKQYYINNKDYLLKQSNIRDKKRRQIDPEYKLRKDIPSIIRRAIKSNGGSKIGNSILDFLPYTIEQLRLHFQNLFDPWMTWENYGKYDPKTWNDNDSATWTWNIDHIRPQSLFHFAIMDCQEFRDCWSLSNLRPYSAKQNWLDGINRTRHNIDIEESDS